MGALLLFGVVAMRYWRLRRAIGRMDAVDEGPLRIELERLAMAWDCRRVPDLVLSTANSSPFLIGTLHPVIVLPAAMGSWSAEEIRAVLLHELTHWRRRDPWIGWLQATVQAIFWFHPCVWLANSRIRQEREAACDAAVLGGGSVAPQAYGETLLKIVGAARGRSLAEGSLAGVFERGTDLPQRLEAIMNYRPGAANFGWGSWAVWSAAALLLLPMATGMTSAEEKPAVAESSSVGGAASGDEATKPKAKKPTSKTAKSPYPQYKSNPAHGATNVDPSLKEIVIRFDREMGPGMSITGDPALMPPLNQAGKPGWRDTRTFVFPVALAEGAYYRIGINSKSHQNFQDTLRNSGATERDCVYHERGVEGTDREGGDAARRFHRAEDRGEGRRCGAERVEGDVRPADGRWHVDHRRRAGGALAAGRRGRRIGGRLRCRSSWSRDGTIASG